MNYDYQGPVLVIEMTAEGIELGFTLRDVFENVAKRAEAEANWNWVAKGFYGAIL